MHTCMSRRKDKWSVCVVVYANKCHASKLVAHTSSGGRGIPHSGRARTKHGVKLSLCCVLVMLLYSTMFSAFNYLFDCQMYDYCTRSINFTATLPTCIYLHARPCTTYLARRLSATDKHMYISAKHACLNIRSTLRSLARD